MNNQYLHAYDVLQESIKLDGSVKSLEAYTPRGLNQAQGAYLIPEDMIDVTREQIRYLKDFGINQNPAELVSVPTNQQELTISAIAFAKEIKRQIKSSITHLQPFMHGTKAQTLAESLGLATPYQTQQIAHQIVENSNDKSKILGYFESQGLNVPKGQAIGSLIQAQLFFDYLLSEGFKAAFVKITRSASGDGTIQVNSKQEIVELLKKPSFLEALQTGHLYMDALIEHNQSPSVLLDIAANGSYQVLGSNYQLLGKKSEKDDVATVHLGARGPISDAHFALMQGHINATAKFLHQNGYIGSANVEGLLTDEKFYAIEINARQTGASTPSLESQLIQRTFNRPNYWYCNNNFKVPESTTHTQVIEALESILYNKNKGHGVILSNFAIIQKGKVQLTAHAKSNAELDEYITEVHHQLNQLNT